MTLNLEQYPINLKQIDADAIRSEALKAVIQGIRKARNNQGLERQGEEERRRKSGEINWKMKKREVFKV